MSLYDVFLGIACAVEVVELFILIAFVYPETFPLFHLGVHMGASVYIHRAPKRSSFNPE
jgi:hypothetical protein